MAMVLYRKKTGENILAAGGRWDRLRNCYDAAPPSVVRRIHLEESQLELAVWFRDWLKAFRRGEPRDVSLAIAGGERRGGKTFVLLMCTVATCLDVPRIGNSGLITWVVSCSFPERTEIDQTLREKLPPEPFWYRYRDAPKFCYTFHNGATLRSISADNPDTLKRGRVDLVFYNEAQKQPVKALSNGIYGTIDKGGLAIVATNPPDKQRGEWVLALKEAIDEKTLSGAKFFLFSSKDNTQVQQDARGRVGDILRLIDPKSARADDEGAWLPVGDRAYPAWNKQRNAAPMPETSDITSTLMAKRYGRGFSFVAGLDFQAWPYHCAAILKVYTGPNGPLYWFVDEVITEQATEDELIDDILERGYESTSIFCVGDASGSWQDGAHKFRGRVSFDFFKARRFFIEPPQRPKGESKTGRSRNPAIQDRLSMVFRLMEQSRLLVDPVRCPRLAEAFKDCELRSTNGQKKPAGRHAHITDAAGYALWYLEPRPTRPRDAGDKPEAFSVPIRRRGSDVI